MQNTLLGDKFYHKPAFISVVRKLEDHLKIQDKFESNDDTDNAGYGHNSIPTTNTNLRPGGPETCRGTLLGKVLQLPKKHNRTTNSSSLKQLKRILDPPKTAPKLWAANHKIWSTQMDLRSFLRGQRIHGKKKLKQPDYLSEFRNYPPSTATVIPAPGFQNPPPHHVKKVTFTKSTESRPLPTRQKMSQSTKPSILGSRCFFEFSSQNGYNFYQFEKLLEVMSVSPKRSIKGAVNRQKHPDTINNAYRQFVGTREERLGIVHPVVHVQPSLDHSTRPRCLNWRPIGHKSVVNLTVIGDALARKRQEKPPYCHKRYLIRNPSQTIIGQNTLLNLLPYG